MRLLSTTSNIRHNVHVKRGLAKGVYLYYLVREVPVSDKIRSCKRSAKRKPLLNNNSSSSNSKKPLGHERGVCSSSRPLKSHRCLPTQRCTKASERCRSSDSPYRSCGEATRWKPLTVLHRFVCTPVPDVQKRLKDESEALAKEMSNLEKKEDYLEKTYTNSKNSLEQVLKGAS